jgi:hypothetical protein
MYLCIVTLLNSASDMDYRDAVDRPVRSGFRVGRALGFNCTVVHSSPASGPLAGGMRSLILLAALWRQVVISLAVAGAPQSCHRKVA